MRPIICALSLNHSAPSGPAMIDVGMLPLGGPGKSVTTPEVVTRAMWPLSSRNQRLPSGPAVTHVEPSGIGNQLKTPAVVRRPAYGASLANQSAPSDPVVIPMTCGGGKPSVGDGSG